MIRDVQIENATTHNYTIQITMNASGFLSDKLPVVLYEHQGPPFDFDELVREFNNLQVYYSKSGWMGKEIAQQWMKEIFLPMAEESSLLIVDSWTGYKEMIQMPDLATKKLEISVLPAGSISQLQPADAYFNWTFKHYLRKISNKLQWKHPDFTLSTKKNFLTLLVLVYNQFKAPRYKEFLLYAWYRTGFQQEHPLEFLTPDQFCLDFKGYISCESVKCTEYCFIRCSYCEKHLCFQH